MLQLLFVTAFAMSVGFVLFARPLARRIGWIDHPGGRKDHKQPTPLVGGVAIYLGIVIGLVFCDCVSNYSTLLVAMGILLAFGVVDDVRGLPPTLRFGAQALSVLILIFLDDSRILDLGMATGNEILYLGWWSSAFTVFALVGLINSINLSDGMDGLAAGLTAIALVWTAIVAVLLNMLQLLPVIIVSLGAIVGYLVFNLRHPWRQQASVFMGDSGSLILGLLLGWVSIKLITQQQDMVRLPPIITLWLVAIPLLDTISVMTRRIIRKRNPFVGDREHVHHLLLVAGFSHGQVVAFLLVSAVLFGGIGILAWRLGVPEPFMVLGFLVLFGVHMWVTFHAWRAAHYAGLIHKLLWGKSSKQVLKHLPL